LKNKGVMLMQNISIDVISQNDVIIRINGEVLENLEEFLLEIKQGEIPTYSIKRSMGKKQKQLEVIKDNTCPQWRSIQKAAETLKQQDNGTAITQWRIRQLVKEGKISYKQDGRRKLVDLNEIKRYYQNSVKVQKQNQKGKLKAIL